MDQQLRDDEIDDIYDLESHICDEKKCFDLKRVHKSWWRMFVKEFQEPYFAKLRDFVARERAYYQVYPSFEEVFEWARLTPLNEVKVVIIGQDPYPTPGRAHGLCFSVKRPRREEERTFRLPRSLGEIYKELLRDPAVKFERPTIDGVIRTPAGPVERAHGELSGWARQGVLLLNTVLTVGREEPNSHAGAGWEAFTDAVIRRLSASPTGVVFMLWGKPARDKADLIDTRYNKILPLDHPVAWERSRVHDKYGQLVPHPLTFLGSGHFSECNEFLESSRMTAIDWGDLLPYDSSLGAGR